jgi:hypothetical protein
LTIASHNDPVLHHIDLHVVVSSEGGTSTEHVDLEPATVGVAESSATHNCHHARREPLSRGSLREADAEGALDSSGEQSASV